MGSDKESKPVVETEKTEVTDETKGSDAPEKGTETKQSDDLAKARQQIDQERANARRAREALEATLAEKEELNGRVSTLQSQLADIQVQLKEQLTAKEYKDLANLDPATTDTPDLVKAHQALAAKAAELEKRAMRAEQFIEQKMKADQEAAAAKHHRELEEEIYSLCDDRVGAQYRNEAIKLANKKVADGDVDIPQSPSQGIKLMLQCYEEIAAKSKPREKPEKKASPATDTGLRGLSVTDIEDSEEFKPGSLDEVAKDMQKKIKAGKWDKRFANTP